LALTTFIPEVWSGKVNVAKDKKFVYASLCNRDYEGDIAQAGDTVHITTLGTPTVAPYVKGVTVIDPAQLATTDDTLVITESEYFAFEVDDIDTRQTQGNVMPKAIVKAAEVLADNADQFIAALYAGIASGNVIDALAITDGDKAYTGLVSLRTLMTEKDIPANGRWVVIPAWYTGLLLENPKFVANPALAQSGANLLNGFVGRAAGFDIYESNNVPVITGDDHAVIAGTNDAMTFAEQINKVEAFRPESSFSDAVKGLYLYGAKLADPAGLVCLEASETAVGG
jgi:hypothetical protein